MAATDPTPSHSVRMWVPASQDSAVSRRSSSDTATVAVSRPRKGGMRQGR